MTNQTPAPITSSSSPQRTPLQGRKRRRLLAAAVGLAVGFGGLGVSASPVSAGPALVDRSLAPSAFVASQGDYADEYWDDDAYWDDDEFWDDDAYWEEDEFWDDDAYRDDDEYWEDDAYSDDDGWFDAFCEELLEDWNWDDHYGEAADWDHDDYYYDDYETYDDDASWDDEAYWDEGYGDEGDDAALATIRVRDDRIDTSGLTAAQARQAEAIWSRWQELIPADQRSMVTHFELMPKSYEGAHVYPDDDDPTTWTLGVAANLGNDLDSILIHEFGHLLTLQAEEVPPGEDDGTCPTYHTGEGCALSGATIASFVQRFWPEEMRDQLAQIEDSDDYYEELEDFHAKNHDRFVTDYAATNPGEDIAETFAEFVLSGRPTGNTIADQKIQTLWDDPDLVALRNQIRANL